MTNESSSILTCEYCREELFGLKRFCSKNCKNESQKKRVELVCSGCKKKFLQIPYLQRATNYCSVTCYHNFTNKKKHRVCCVCGKEFVVKAYLVDKGYGLFCSKLCQHTLYPSRIILSCLLCKKQLSVPPSKQRLVKFCSTKCKDDYKRDYVQCTCKQCHRDFQIPRSDINRGRGTFCTWDCFIKYKGESSLEEKIRLMLEKNKVPYKQEMKLGRFHVDFVIEQKKLAIECDGEFWHMQDKIQERDRRKDKTLKKLGYRVLRLSGQLIKKSSEQKLVRLLEIS